MGTSWIHHPSLIALSLPPALPSGVPHAYCLASLHVPSGLQQPGAPSVSPDSETCPVWPVPDMGTQFWFVKVHVQELVGAATNSCQQVQSCATLCFFCLSSCASDFSTPDSGIQNTNHQTATIAMTRPLCFLQTRPECFLLFVKQDQET